MEERIKMIKAMEFIIRHLNAEGYMEQWLTEGVPDGDIEFGDLTVKPDDAELLDYFIEDKGFADLTGIFLLAMRKAYKDGGLYCDNIVSN